MKKDKAGIGCVFLAAVKIDNWIYFSAWTLNGLFKLNIETSEIVFLKRFSSEQIGRYLHRYAIVHDKEIWFIPACGRNITRVNIETLEMRELKIPMDRCIWKNEEKFSSVILYGKEIWMIPWAYDSLLKVDMESGEFEKIGYWQTPNNFIDGIKISNYIYLCPAGTDHFVTYDLKSGELKNWEWDYPKDSFCKMIYAEESLWILPKKKYPYIVRHDIKSEIETRIKLTVNVQNDSLESCHVGALWKNEIWMPPFGNDHWIRIDIKTNMVSYEKLPEFEHTAVDSYHGYQAVAFFDDRIAFLSEIQPMITYMKDSEEHICTELFLKGDSLQELLRQMQNASKIENSKDILMDSRKHFTDNKIPLQYYVENLIEDTNGLNRLFRDEDQDKAAALSYGEKINAYILKNE